MATEIYAGIGSNISPARHLDIAIRELQRHCGEVELSPTYRNPAVGFAGDDFLNLVVRFRSDWAVGKLERMFSKMEYASGRRNTGTEGTQATGSRTLDIDLLLYGSMIDPQARLPRSDILRYAFVLRPLAELAPDLVHPLTGRAMAVHWNAVEARGPKMRRVTSLHFGRRRQPGSGR